MRKKIALVLGIVALTSSVCLVGFNINKSRVASEVSNNTTTMTSSDDDTNIETVSSSADMIPFDLDELNSRSEIIVKGKAINQSYYTTNDEVFSKTTMKVEKVYKGNVKVGDSLNLVEWGGITNEEEYNLKMFEEKIGKKPTEEEKKKARSKKLRVLIAEIPYSQVGKSSVYFLRKASTKEFGKQIEKDTYTPIGVQGRFDINGAPTDSIATNSITTNSNVTYDIDTNDGDIFERPRGTDNELPELKITESDLGKISMK